jgi:hypothetical protein
MANCQQIFYLPYNLTEVDSLFPELTTVYIYIIILYFIIYTFGIVEREMMMMMLMMRSTHTQTKTPLTLHFKYEKYTISHIIHSLAYCI